MKRKLQSLFLLLMIGTIAANAQPVITAAGVNPQIGESLKWQGTSSNSITPPDSGGVNRVWDYSNLQDSGYFITTNVLSPKGLPLADSFPSTNIAFEFAFDYTPTYYDTIYHYDTISNNIWAEFGSVESLSPLGVFSFSPFSPYLHYPISYKDRFIDSLSSYINFGYSENDYDTLYADGYGTLKLPNATYTNVLRVHSNDYNGENDNYWFYANGVHFPLLELTATTSTDTNGAIYVAYWNAGYYSGTPLPIEISAFTASWQDKLPYLHWNASNTENTKQFNIQRSVDGHSFFTVGQVGLNGGSSYHFEDNYVPTSNVYYRLQQLDKDGQTFYSNMAQLTVNNKQFSINPNPAKDFTTISFNKTVDKATIAVYDITGKAVITQSLSGTNSYNLNTQTLTNGVYVIKVNTATGSYNEKLLINK